MKDFNKKGILIFLLLALGSTLFSQTGPARDSIQINSIKASVESNGALFRSNFSVPATTADIKSISTIKSAGLWLGGRDAQGKLHLSAQMSNENGKTDFYPGYLYENGVPYPEFNFIAHATKAQVNAHIANPQTPSPAIYGWPGSGNPYFFDHHGFDLPFSLQGVAGFYDKDFNGQYNPPAGDYPGLGVRGCPLSVKFFPDETLWFSFHDVGAHTQSGGEPMKMNVSANVFGINCPEGSPVDRAVYVHYKLTNRNTEVLDSCYLGAFIDFEIGNGGDDFIGCDSLRRIVYAYNGDDTDEGGFEKTPPVMAVDLLRGPLNELGEEVTQWHFVPVDNTPLNSPQAYYNLLAGRRPNGTPFPNKGLMYTGDPLNPAKWSEKSANNTPGERKAVASFGPFTLLPGAINELILGYFWVRKDPNGNVDDNLSLIAATDKHVQDLYDNCFSLFNGVCPGNVATNTPASNLPITIYPNPFTDQVHIESTALSLKTIVLYDVFGRQIRQVSANGGSFADLQTGDLPPGFYWAQVRTQDGQTGAFKLVKE